MIGGNPLSSRLPVTGTVVKGEVTGFANWPKPWTNFITAVWQICVAAQQSGVTADRPTENLWVGRSFFDTTLGNPIWFNGTVWVDAAGAPA